MAVGLLCSTSVQTIVTKGRAYIHPHDEGTRWSSCRDEGVKGRAYIHPHDEGTRWSTCHDGVKLRLGGGYFSPSLSLETSEKTKASGVSVAGKWFGCFVLSSSGSFFPYDSPRIRSPHTFKIVRETHLDKQVISHCLLACCPTPHYILLCAHVCVCVCVCVRGIQLSLYNIF